MGSHIIEVEQLGEKLLRPWNIMAVAGTDGGALMSTKIWRMFLLRIRKSNSYLSNRYYCGPNGAKLVVDSVWGGTVFCEAVRVLT